MRMRSLLLGGACLGGVLWWASAARRKARQITWKNKVVIITGGSRGLGLVMARQLVQAQAKVAICARAAHELEQARVELATQGGTVFAETCDVTDADAIEAFVKAVVRRFGRIDVLINNAGIIQVGPVETMRSEDFERTLATHFWGPWHFVSAVLPMMRAQNFGRIANISSIGGQVSLPHMVPYCASKFALTGFSKGLQAELAGSNIHVTTVHPHLMRTGSHHNAQFKGNHRAEFTWFSMGASLPLISMSAERSAQIILDAIEHGDAEVTLTLQGNLAGKLYRVFPKTSAALAGVVGQLLPSANGYNGKAFTGHESHSWLSPSVLTTLGDRAAHANNELP